MRNVVLGIVAALGLLALIPITIALMYMGANNREVGLRNQATAQQRNLENMYDKTWKIISQQAEISSEYKDAFAKVYPDLMAGRYGNARGGALMSFITESNPTFDTTLYQKLANSVEALRTEFAREQSKLLDIKREHDDVRTKIPSSFFVGGRSPLEVKLITSTRATNAMETGKDDDVSLFQKEKAEKL